MIVHFILTKPHNEQVSFLLRQASQGAKQSYPEVVRKYNNAIESISLASTLSDIGPLKS
jgi:hypothetical protein